MARHHSHPDIVKRLRRVEGHVAKIVTMIEAGAPCLDVAQQLQAVESALGSAKRVFVQDHIEHCFDGQNPRHAGEWRNALAEFKQITQYL